MTPKPAPRPLSMLAQRAHRKAVRRRWVKRLVLGGALAFLAISVTSYMFRGTITRWLALSRLEAALGYEASCSSAEVLPNGRVSLPGFALRAQGIDGDAGEVVSAARVELAVDWVRAVTDPASAVMSVRLIDPVFRLSVDVQTGELSVGAAAGGGAATPAVLPPVSVERARLIFGEHGDGWFAPLHEISISGSMRRDPAQAGVYAVRLTEDAPVGRSPAVLEGEIDLRGGDGSLALRDIDFAALRSHASAPSVETLLRRLRIGGRLPLATLSYERDGSFHVGVDLHSVDVVAPTPVPGEENERLMMRLTGVTGRLDIDQDGLHADLVGLFEDLDARVVLESSGLSVSADASAEIIVSDYRWGPSPGLLPFAPALATEFVHRFSGPEATINGRVRLAQVDGVASANGLFTWRDGSAAFEDFPYPLLDVAGRMSFDDSGVYVTDLRGVGPTGADIRAEVVAVPPGDDAEITATIVATGAPTDEHLFNAIGGEHGEAVASFFSGEGSHGITPGGEVELSIEVYNRGGELGRWGWDVRAASPELGVSAERLGYPLIARDFELVLDEDEAVATLPVLEGPTGLRGSMTLNIPLSSDGGSETGEFVIDEAPVDEVLVGALREASPEFFGRFDGWRIDGAVQGRGAFSITDSGELDVAGDFRFQDVSVRDENGFTIASRASGGVHQSEELRGVTADATGPGGAQLSITVSGARSSEHFTSSTEFQDVQLNDETRRWLGALHAEVGQTFEDAVEEWGLGGSVDGEVSIAPRGSGDLHWRVDLTNIEDATLTLGGERVGFEDVRHRHHPVALSDDGVSFVVSAATVVVEGQSIGEISLLGTTPSAGSVTRLEATGRDVKLDSRAVRALASRWAGEYVAQTIEEADPAGEADLWVEVVGREDGTVGVSGRVEPRALEVTRDGSRASFSSATGAVFFDDGGLRFDELRLRSDGWDLLLDGSYEETGGFAGAVDLAAERVTPALLASLPPEAAQAASAIGLEIGEGGELWATGKIGAGSELVIGFTRAGFALGVPIEDAAGRLTIRREEGVRTGELALESFRAAGVPMRRGGARLVWDDEGASVRVPDLWADCAGGIIRGQARLAETSGFGGEREYFVDVRCADVPLAWIIERPKGEARPEDGLAARGLIGGQLRVRGVIGGDGSRRVGRGFFTISGGEVLRLPLLTPAFELLNFQPPVGERLTDAAIEFGVSGDRLVFDRLYVQSDSLVVWATGEARLDDGTLDLAVRTRGRTRVPLVSDIIDAFKNELLGARITGEIRSPRYELAQLPNAGRVLLGVVAPGAGGRVGPAAAPARPALTDHVPSVLEPIDE